MPKRVDWYQMWLEMGWDMDVYDRFLNAGDDDRFRHRGLLQFVKQATVDELRELVTYLKGLNNRSVAGLIHRLNATIEQQAKSPL